MWKYFHINDMKAGIYNIIAKKDDKFAGSFSFSDLQSDTKISMVKKSVSSIDGFIAGEDYTLSGVGSFDEELKIIPAEECNLIIYKIKNKPLLLKKQGLNAELKGKGDFHE